MKTIWLNVSCMTPWYCWSWVRRRRQVAWRLPRHLNYRHHYHCKTYIIDAEGKASIFHFDDEICGFSCGLFTVDKKTLPCLVYATFNGQVHVYYSLEGTLLLLRLLHILLNNASGTNDLWSRWFICLHFQKGFVIKVKRACTLKLKVARNFCPSRSKCKHNKWGAE